MKIGILNSELGIASIDSTDDLGIIQINEMEKHRPEGAEFDQLVFFYMPCRDWIVINKSHNLYKYWIDIITVYLQLSENSRKRAYVEAPNDTIRAGYDILEDVIKERILIYGNEV